MSEISLETLLPVIALVILAGSLLGSTFIYLGGGGRGETPDDSKSAGFQRPPTRQSNAGGGTTVYHAVAPEIREPRGSMLGTLLGMIWVGGVAFVLATVGMTIYHSPWAPDVTVRHMVASLHCDLSDRVGLSPSQAGAPGYHVRNDRDRDGVACEVHNVAFGLEPEQTVAVLPLSQIGPVLPDTAAAALAPQ